MPQQDSAVAVGLYVFSFPPARSTTGFLPQLILAAWLDLPRGRDVP